MRHGEALLRMKAACTGVVPHQRKEINFLRNRPSSTGQNAASKGFSVRRSKNSSLYFASVSGPRPCSPALVFDDLASPIY